MPLQRPGDVNGRDPAGRANRYAKAGFKEPITLILGQAPRRPVGGWAPWRGEPRAPQGGAGTSRRAAGGHVGGEAGGGKAVARGRRWRAAGGHPRGGGGGERGAGEALASCWEAPAGGRQGGRGAAGGWDCVKSGFIFPIRYCRASVVSVA